jgi:hypothetical protein
MTASRTARAMLSQSDVSRPIISYRLHVPVRPSLAKIHGSCGCRKLFQVVLGRTKPNLPVTSIARRPWASATPICSSVPSRSPNVFSCCAMSGTPALPQFNAGSIVKQPCPPTKTAQVCKSDARPRHSTKRCPTSRNWSVMKGGRGHGKNVRGGTSLK